jgi:hypothetical protein
MESRKSNHNRDCHPKETEVIKTNEESQEENWLLIKFRRRGDGTRAMSSIVFLLELPEAGKRSAECGRDHKADPQKQDCSSKCLGGNIVGDQKWMCLVFIAKRGLARGWRTESIIDVVFDQIAPISRKSNEKTIEKRKRCQLEVLLLARSKQTFYSHILCKNAKGI